MNRSRQHDARTDERPHDGHEDAVAHLGEHPEAGRRQRQGGALDQAGTIALVATAIAWVGVLGSMLRHRIYVSHHSLISYAHVWYGAYRVGHSHGPPVRMPVV